MFLLTVVGGESDAVWTLVACPAPRALPHSDALRHKLSALTADDVSDGNGEANNCRRIRDLTGAINPEVAGHAAQRRSLLYRTSRRHL